MLPDEVTNGLEKQHYLFVGQHRHAAVKTCQYAKSSMSGGNACYKNLFYGITSYQCIQGTANIVCYNNCIYCWRAHPEELGAQDARLQIRQWDGPETIVDGFIAAHRKLLSGMGGHDKADRKVWESSRSPKHVALSVLGEPVAYPRITELLAEFHNRGISTFLVTAGTAPAAIEKMAKGGVLPTQFYLSMGGYDEESYNRFMKPKVAVGWKNYRKSIKLMSGMKTRRAVRTTLMCGLNMVHPEKWARLILETGAEYLEAKAYAAVGYSRQRVGMDHMPRHEEVREFARELEAHTGYIYAAEHRPSRVVLLCKNQEALENRIIDFSRIH